MRESHRRFAVSAESRERVLKKFLAAIATGDRKAVMALLAEEVEYVSDAGGKVVASLKILRGRERIRWVYPHPLGLPLHRPQFRRRELPLGPGERRTAPSP